MYRTTVFVEGFPQAFMVSHKEESISKSELENIKSRQKAYLETGEDSLIILEGDDKGKIHFVASKIVAVCNMFVNESVQLLPGIGGTA